jgi:hypothetical protein
VTGPPADLASLDVPAPGPADGAELLGQLAAALTRYVVLPSAESADAVTCWIAASHGQQAFEHATRLVIKSPEKRCGKSRLMDVIEATCGQPMITVNISPAALVRSIGDDPPTLLLDEADTVFGRKAGADQHEDLRGILNAGHQRNRPYVRWDVATRSRENCPTFAMAALAAIGDMPDTIEDRAVIIHMRRRAAGETARPFRQRRDRPALRELGERVGAWVSEHLDELRDAEPAMPLEDREADTWEPLIAIGDLAGGDWPARIRKAAEVLTAAASDSQASLGVRLLTDLRNVFADEPQLASAQIIARLCAMPEAPWSTLAKGAPIDQRKLATLLRPYDVRPHTVRIGPDTPRGYEAADLHDAWARYVPPERNIRNTATQPGVSPGQDTLDLVADANRVADASATRDHQAAAAYPGSSAGVADASATAQQTRSPDQQRCGVADVADPPDTAGWPVDSNGAVVWTTPATGPSSSAASRVTHPPLGANGPHSASSRQQHAKENPN